ncbi:MAG: Mu-like prophage major head subunit gpT family protein [Caulobacter sp.]
MLINEAALAALYTGFKAVYSQGFQGADSRYAEVAMTVPSSTGENAYGWLGQLPRIREWIGPRHVRSLSAYGYKIANRKFELTVAVPRENIEDDTVGVFTPLFSEMGRSSANHPDELLFGLLSSGFSEACYDGQNFFDTDHPGAIVDGAPVSISNMQAGAGEPWFLLDTSRAIKPLIWQTRTDYKLTALNNEGDENVFFRDEFVYGVRARVNAGFGLWQLAFGSKGELNATTYAAARAAMSAMRGDEGTPLGIKPDTLVVGPALEEAALQLLNAERTADDTSNVWKGTAKLIISPWLA